MHRQPAPNDRRPEAIATGEPVRCAYCGAVLATTGPEGLRIHRSQLEVLIGGAEHATFVCYRPSCRRINRFTRAALSLCSPGLSHSGEARRL